MENQVRADTPFAADEEIDFLRYLRDLWHARWVIVGCTVLAAVIALAVAFLTPPAYQATARLVVNESKFADRSPQLTRANVASYMAMVNSPTLASQIVKELGLDQPPLEHTPQSFLENVLTTEVFGETNIIVARVRLPDKELAARTATTFVRRAVELARRLNQDESVTARDLIKAQVDESEHRMKRAKTALDAFRNRTQIELARKDVDAILTQRGVLLQLLIDIEAERARLRMAEEQLSKKTRIESLRRSVENDPAMLELSRNRPGATPENLLPLELRNEYVNQVHEGLEFQVTQSRTKLAGLERQRADLVDIRKLDGAQLEKLSDLYAKEGALLELQTEFDLSRAAYLEIATQYQQSRIQVTSRGAQLQVLDEALVPEKRVSPRLRTQTTLAIAVGFIISVVGVLLYSALRPSHRPQRHVPAGTAS